MGVMKRGMMGRYWGWCLLGLLVDWFFVFLVDLFDSDFVGVIRHRGNKLDVKDVWQPDAPQHSVLQPHLAELL